MAEQSNCQQPIERVVVIDDGFVEGILYRFGMQDRVVGLGGAWIKDYTYTFETTDGTTYEYKNGMNPVRYLIPELAISGACGDRNSDQLRDPRLSRS